MNYVVSLVCDMLCWCVDDGTCRFWDVEAGVQKMVIKLKCLGMSVCWHPSDSVKVHLEDNRQTDGQTDRQTNKQTDTQYY